MLQAGARVMTLDQLEGLKDPSLPCWTNEDDCDGDPPRLWSPAGLFPGTAFTRSIGDSGEGRGQCAWQRAQVLAARCCRCALQRSAERWSVGAAWAR